MAASVTGRSRAERSNDLTEPELCSMAALLGKAREAHQTQPAVPRSAIVVRARRRLWRFAPRTCATTLAAPLAAYAAATWRSVRDYGIGSCTGAPRAGARETTGCLA